MMAAKPVVMQRHMDLLQQRYDLGDRPSGVMMSGGKKPVQAGVRVKLRPGTTWEQLSALGPQGIKEKDLWPLGFLPLPHPNHAEGGMLFPQFHRPQILRNASRSPLIWSLCVSARPCEPPA
jgi:hypothetical protein